MGFIEFLIEGSSREDKWKKYFMGRRVMTVIKSSGAPTYDKQGKRIGQLSGGTPILVVGEYPTLPAPKPTDIKPNSKYDLRVGATDPKLAASKSYQQRNTPEYTHLDYDDHVYVATYDKQGAQTFHLVSLANVDKPIERKLFGYLKPQRLLKGKGSVQQGFAIFKNKQEYFQALYSGIEHLEDLQKKDTAAAKDYLLQLATLAYNNKTSSESLKTAYEFSTIANSAHSYGTLTNDFTELLGPFMVNAPANTTIAIPLKSNEAMIDFKVGDTGFSSKRAGTLSNTLKCQHVIDAIKGSIKMRDASTPSYQLMEVMAKAPIKEAPSKITAFLDATFSHQRREWMANKSLPPKLNFGVSKGKQREWLSPNADYSDIDNYNLQMTNVEKLINYLVLREELDFSQYVQAAFQTIRVIKMDINFRTGAIQDVSVSSDAPAYTKILVRYKGRPDEKIGFDLR